MIITLCRRGLLKIYASFCELNISFYKTLTFRFADYSPIDVSVRPNHQQLFAQALVALGNGEKCYFDAEQVKLIMQSNCQFEVVQPIDQYFRLYFEPADDEKEGEYMTAAEIFDFLKKQIGSSLKVNSLMGFGRKLANMTQLNHKRFADGMKYLVKKR